MKQSIPTYSADGRRLCNYAVARIEDLLSQSRVVVERGRNGKIKCAHMRPSSGATPIRKTAHMGQHYSFEERFRNGGRAWKHSNMLMLTEVEEIVGKSMNREEADLFIRAVFRAVPLSVMYRNHPLAAAPSIDAGCRRKKSRPARPIEFDSQKRLSAAA